MESKPLVEENMAVDYIDCHQVPQTYARLLIKRQKYFGHQYFNIFFGGDTKNSFLKIVGQKGKLFNVFQKSKKILWAQKKKNKWIIYKCDYPGMELMCIKLEEDPNYDYIKSMTIISRKHAFIDEPPVISDYFEIICKSPRLYPNFRINFNKKPIYNSVRQQYMLDIGLSDCIASEKTLLLQDKSIVIGRQENNYFKIKYKDPWNILDAVAIVLSRLLE